MFGGGATVLASLTALQEARTPPPGIASLFSSAPGTRAERSGMLRNHLVYCVHTSWLWLALDIGIENEACVTG